MKISYKKKVSGFTLIEMIGVLAVIAILAALLIPKIFEAINNARINNAAISVQTVKTACADHYAKYGSLANTNGTAVALPIDSFDLALLSEGFLDKPFSVKISSVPTNTVHVVTGVAETTAVTGANSAYNLDAAGAANDAGPASAAVVEAVIYGVNANDAWELSKRIDGDALSAANATADDIIGRVKYQTPGPTTEVHVYLTHR
jgi:prepilin-type N-terminal cleavage/methylation domain-containing protein